MDGDDKVIVVLIVAAVIALCFVSWVDSFNNSGPATKTVEACAAIEDQERSVACFEAIGR